MLGLGLFIWYAFVPDAPWDDYALTMGGVVVEGVVVDAWEEREFTDRGSITYSTLVYRFDTEHGHSVEGKHDWEGELLEDVGARFDVEYLRRSPEVNRPALGGSGWGLARRTAAALVIFGLCVFPGASMLRRRLQ